MNSDLGITNLEITIQELKRVIRSLKRIAKQKLSIGSQGIIEAKISLYQEVLVHCNNFKTEDDFFSLIEEEESYTLGSIALTQNPFFKAGLHIKLGTLSEIKNLRKNANMEDRILKNSGKLERVA